MITTTLEQSKKLKELGRFVKNQRTHLIIECYCGKQFTALAYNVKAGKTKSCGCWNTEQRQKKGKNLRHGLSRSPEASVWHSMIQRCQYSKHISYKHYGTKGVTVCTRWQTFANFYADMGTRPSSKHQIDRIDNSQGYKPGNCRWVTAKENMNNRKSNKHIEYNGERLTYSQWAAKIGMKRATFNSRLRDGWEPSKVITTPVRIR